MKTQTGIWIDGSKAIIISLVEDIETVLELPANIENRVHHRHEGDHGTFMGNHHINNEQKFEERKKHQTEFFLNKVMNEIGSSDEIYIMGPSEMKSHLKTKIEEDKHMHSKLKGVEAADHLTLNQCVARVKNFFKVSHGVA